MDFLRKGFLWVKSEAEGTFDYLKVKIDKSLSSARRFFDNFSEKLKQRLIETKNFIDKAMLEILEPLSLMVRLVHSYPFEKVQEKLALLVTRLIKETKRLASYFKIFKSSTKEAEGATRQRYKCSLDSEDEEKLGSFENLVFEFGKFLGIILQDGPISKLVGTIFNNVYSPCVMDEELKKVDEFFKEMKLGKDEREAAFSSLKSKMVETFNYLKGKVNNFFESARRFFDNLSEKLNNLILSTKNLIETAMGKILEFFGSMLHGEKKGLNLLNDEMKNLASCVKMFMSYMKDVKEETGKGYKSSWNRNMLPNLISMVLDFVATFSKVVEMLNSN